MDIQGIAYIGEHVANLDRSVAFYERALGRTFRRIDDENAELVIDGVPFLLEEIGEEIIAEEGFSAPSAVLFGVKVPDVEAAAAYLDGVGVAHERRHEYLAVQDPDGYLFTVFAADWRAA